LNTIERLDRFDLMQLLGLEHEADLRPKGLGDALKQLVIAISLEQHGIRQAPYHHPLPQGNRELIVIIDIRIGLQEGLRIGISLRGFLSYAGDLLITHASGADQGNEFLQSGFHGATSTTKRRIVADTTAQ